MKIPRSKSLFPPICCSAYLSYKHRAVHVGIVLAEIKLFSLELTCFCCVLLWCELQLTYLPLCSFFIYVLRPCFFDANVKNLLNMLLLMMIMMIMMILHICELSLPLSFLMSQYKVSYMQNMLPVLLYLVDMCFRHLLQTEALLSGIFVFRHLV